MDKIAITAPCPWCGTLHPEETAVFGRSIDICGKSHTFYQVSCSCGCEGPTSDDRNEAVRKWNEGPKYLRAMCDKLAKLVLDFAGSCPFDYYESKRGMPCEHDPSKCRDNKDGECWIAYAKNVHE
jgi:hypothetical protein